MASRGHQHEKDKSHLFDYVGIAVDCVAIIVMCCMLKVTKRYAESTCLPIVRVNYSSWAIQLQLQGSGQNFILSSLLAKRLKSSGRVELT